jgi:hypothetical protein
MRRIYSAAVALSILLAACTHASRDSRAAISESPVSPAAPGLAATEPEAGVESQAAPQPPASSSAPEGPAENAPAPAAAAQTAPVASEAPGQPASGTSKSRPSKQAAGTKNTPVSPVPAAAAAPAVAAPSKASTPPPLDLKGLEQRLRETRAIGVFTKLSLKNQVDELLSQFKAFHQGKPGVTVGQLRQKYELLLMKVVTLLQDGDPGLASAVSSSREAIWDVLTDPQKFAAIAYST